MLQPTNLFILNVQFCKSCPTHSWCTHHDQQKYLTTYQKLKHYLQQQFGHDIFVQGNVIPDQLVPIKPAENKYFNTKTNKYVTFPSIGAFQLTLQSQLIFSKKKTNTWPHFAQIAQIIYLKIHGQPPSKSPSQKHNTMKNVKEKNLITDIDIKTQKDHVSLKNQSFLDHNDKRSTFYKNRSPNQHKNFTLTDHFKNYHNGNYKTPFNNSKHVSDQYFTTANTDNENMFSEISSFRNGNSSEKEFLEFKKSFDTFGLEGKLPEFFKKKAFMKENSGKKEMIIRLDSIEEQSVLMDENNPSYGQNINLTNTHTTFKSKSKENHKKLMKRFTDDFEQLEAKFKHFEQRVETIREQNKKFDQRDSSGKLNDRILKEINDLKKKEKCLRSSEIKETPNDEGQEDQMMDNPIIFARKKLKNIEDYINGTEQQKNEKLKKIYGEWKLLKKPYKGRNYVSPYKVEVSKRTGKTKNDKSKDEDEDDFSSSCSSSEQEIMKPKAKPKVQKHKLPKMTGLKSPKSNQILAQEKFYSTAREKFQEFGSRKLNDKMSEKKFDSFSNNSVEKQFHRSSAGVKQNTFDQIIQGKKESSELNVDSRMETHPHSFNHQDKHSQQKGKQLKSLPKKKTKGQFLTKQTSSRQMSRSSRNIHLNEMADKYPNEDQKLDNDYSVHSKTNSQSRKVKRIMTNKNAMNSNSKSVKKLLDVKDKKRHSQDQSQDNEHVSCHSQQESGSEQPDQSHQNSQSLQDNFFASASPQSGSLGKNTNPRKRAEEKSIGKTKEWRTFDGQSSTKKNSQKRARKLVAQNQALDQKRKRRESVDEDKNRIDIEQQSLRRFAGQNFAQSSFGSQNQVITTNQHKLSKKSKVQKESQISKAKKSAKNNEQTKSNLKSQNQDDSEIQNSSQQVSTKRNSLEKSKHNKRATGKNKEKTRSDQTIRLDKESQKQPQEKKVKTTVRSEFESKVLSDDESLSDEMIQNKSDSERKTQQQQEGSEDNPDMQSEIDQSRSLHKVQNDKTVRNQNEFKVEPQTKGLAAKELHYKKTKQKMVSKRKDQNFQKTSQKRRSGHSVNENEKTEQQSQNQNQRDSEQDISEGQTIFNKIKDQTTSNKNIQLAKKPESTQASKKKKFKTKQSSIKPPKKKVIINGVDQEQRISDDEKDSQSLIESCNHDQAEQKRKQSVAEKQKVQQKNKKISQKQYQEVSEEKTSQSQLSQNQSRGETLVIHQADKSKIQNLNKPSKKKQSIKTQQQQSQLQGDSMTHKDNSQIDLSQKSSNSIKNESNTKVLKENKNKQQQLFKSQKIGDKVQSIADQNQVDGVNSKAINQNKNLQAKYKTQNHKKAEKVPNYSSQNHQEVSHNSEQEPQKVQNENQNFSKSHQSSVKDERENHSAKDDESESEEHQGKSQQSNHSQVAIKNKKTKYKKHRQRSKQEMNEQTKQKSKQLRVKGKNTNQSDLQSDDGQDRMQPSKTQKSGSQQKQKTSRKIKQKKPSQQDNHVQSEGEQPSLDEEQYQQECSEQMNEQEFQQNQDHDLKDQNSKQPLTKYKKQKQSKNLGKNTKVQKVEIQQNARKSQTTKKSSPHQSTKAQNKTEKSLSNIQNASQNGQSQNDLTSQDSQGEEQLNHHNQINQIEQGQALQQELDKLAPSSIKKSSKNKHAQSNKNESKKKSQNQSKKAYTRNQSVNSSSHRQEEKQQDSQHSHASQEQFEKECLKQKSFESPPNQDSMTVNQTKQKREKKQKENKSLDNTKVKQTNVLRPDKRKDGEQQAQARSVHESEKQKENAENLNGQVQDNGSQIVPVVNDQRLKTPPNLTVQTSKSKKQKNSNNNNELYPNNQTNHQNHQQSTDQRPNSTSRSTRNKILNVYETDRCKDQDEASDEEELDVQQRCMANNIKNQGNNANQETVVNAQKKDQKDQHSKDVGIQMNNSLCLEKSVHLNESEVGPSVVQRNNEGEQDQKQSRQKMIRQKEKQDGDVEGREDNNGKKIDKEELVRVDVNDHFKQSIVERNSESSHERGQNTEQQIEKSPQGQDSYPTGIRDNTINQQPNENIKSQLKPRHSPSHTSPHSSTTHKPIRAPITKQFYGPSFSLELQTYPTRQNLPLTTTLTQLPLKSQMSPFPASARSKDWVLFNQKSIQVQKIILNHSLPNLMKCVKILSEINEFLLIRLFEDPFMTITGQTLDQQIFGVWLSINNHWRCVLVNLKQVLLSQQTHDFYYMIHQGTQLWPIILQKALASGLGGYSKLAATPCYKLFSILTGSNSLFFNVKQDPTKNSRILRYITDCQNKNFVIHAEKVCKNLEQLQNKDKQARIYYILSQRTVNESDTLLQIRDSTKPQSHWTKLSKFVQEFKSIQILQLRINHNFSSLALPKPTSTQNMTIVSLNFNCESFGSITLSTEPCPVGLLRAFLYKEEKSNYLKLVGQAQEKKKATLFFDCCFAEGKYWLFVECGKEAKVTYLGENQPNLQLIEQVKGDGLKNDWTQYLPVRIQQTSKIRAYKQNLGSRQPFKMPNKLNMSKFTETGMSFRSQEEKISRLRENFVDYLLRQKERV